MLAAFCRLRASRKQQKSTFNVCEQQGNRNENKFVLYFAERAVPVCGLSFVQLLIQTMQEEHVLNVDIQ